MFVIVSIAGQQFKVSEGQQIFVHQLDAKEGDKVSFDQVLLVSSGSDVTLGKPSVSGAKVNATVLRHAKGDKVIVFKKKRRKGYQKSNGHRQQLTQLLVESIKA